MPKIGKNGWIFQEAKEKSGKFLEIRGGVMVKSTGKSRG